MVWKKLSDLRSRDSFWIFLVIAAVTVTFFPAIQNQTALMDDLFYLTHARRPIDSWQALLAPVLDLRTPLVTLSFRFDWLLFGEKYFFTAAHLENILLHAGSAVVFYQLLRILHWKTSEGQDLTVPPLGCAITTLIFACHPQRVESVVWIAERKDVLAMFLGLSAFFFFYRNLKKTQTSFAAPFLLLLSFAAKPMWIFFAVPAALLIWVEKRSFSIRTMAKLLWPVLLATLLYIIMQIPLVTSALRNVVSGQSRPLWQKAEIILYNYGLYFLKTVIPVRLCPVYPHYNPDFSCRWITLIPLLLPGIALLAFKKELRQGVLFGWGPALTAFAVVLIPTVGFTTVGNTDFADRYSYLPSIMLWIPLALQFQLWQPTHFIQKMQCMILVLLYIEFLLWQTVQYLPSWSDPDKYDKTILDLPNPNSDYVVYQSSVYLMEGKIQESSTLIHQKLRISHYDMEAVRKMAALYILVQKGAVHFMNGNPEQGIRYYKTYCKSPDWMLINPCSVEFLKKIFTDSADYCLNKYHDRKKAAALYFRCAKILRGRDIHYYYFYCGKAKLIQGNYPGAISYFEKALAAAPHENHYKKMLEECRIKVKSLQKK